MELRPLIKKKPTLEDGYTKYVVSVMGLIGLLVGGYFVAKFIVNVYR